MASNLLPLTTILLLILSTLSIVSAFVEDSDGDSLINGGYYYIRPLNLGFGGGFTLTPKNSYSPCPPYIKRSSDESYPGIPAKISSPLRIRFIPLSSRVSIVFNTTITTCMVPLGWQVINDEESGKSYVATGGSGQIGNPAEEFEIEQPADEATYTIRHSDKNVGFFKDSGLLGVTDDIPVPVIFTKVSTDEVPESTAQI